MKICVVLFFALMAASCGGYECPDLEPWQQLQYEAATPKQQPLLCAQFLFEKHTATTKFFEAGASVEPEDEKVVDVVFTVFLD